MTGKKVLLGNRFNFPPDKPTRPFNFISSASPFVTSVVLYKNELFEHQLAIDGCKTRWPLDLCSFTIRLKFPCNCSTECCCKSQCVNNCGMQVERLKALRF
ncbi:hypothetical protein O6P43_030492 [Quillaja saponaria]|uniref:Uncharacterized protein n=1 Tax=Quillaja saponaria TaxID=32244 RepID=A0AAD7P7Z5_QUISA|nr:hypothetical protein O6P43_030492 [Quillaja saponaria]